MKKKVKRKVAIGDLVIDKKLTEIRKINIFYVSEYRQNYRNGVNMPLMIVDSETLRVISGNHRLMALRSEYSKDPGHEVEVEVRQYDSEKDALIDVAKENLPISNPLTGIARRRMILALIGEGATVEEVAVLFHRPLGTIEKWGEEDFIEAIGPDGTTGPKPRKVGPEIPEGEVVSEEEYEGHIDRDISMSPLQASEQLTRWLDAGWVKYSDENIDVIDGLVMACNRWMKKKGKKAA